MRRVLLVLLFSVACWRPASDPPLEAAMSRLRETATRADSIAVYHVANEIDADYGAVAAAAKQTVAGYPVRGQIALPEAERLELVNLLADRMTFENHPFDCTFIPHHVLQVTAGRETVNVVICLKCGDVEFEQAGTRSVRGDANGALRRLLRATV